MPRLRSLLWFRKGLRLHDNPALLAAIDGAEQFCAVFCLDPWFIQPDKVGANRLSFLLESLAGAFDLHSMRPQPLFLLTHAARCSSACRGCSARRLLI